MDGAADRSNHARNLRGALDAPVAANRTTHGAMTADSWWLVAYAVTIGTVAFTAALRREPTLLRGRSLFLLTAVFTALWLGSLTLDGRRPSLTALVVAGAFLALTFALRARWLVVRAMPTVVDQSIADSARRLLLVCEGAPGNRRIVCSTCFLDVRAGPIGWIGTHITLPLLPRERRLELFRKLLGKQYRSAVPLPRIRL
jgi:hypothetical protein